MKYQNICSSPLEGQNEQPTVTQPLRLVAPLLATLGILLWGTLYQPDTASAAAPAAPLAQTIPGQPTSPLIFLSASHGGEAETNLEEIRYRDEDIVVYSASTQQLGIYFDGSAHGLGPVDLEDFELLDDGSVYFTINRAFTIPNPNGSPTELRVDDSDVVKYEPASDTFSLVLQGAEVGLTHSSEDIDALAFAPDGRLLLSTIGSAKVNGANGVVKAKDEDLLSCDPVSKLCELYFDGSDLKLTSSGEDLMALWVKPTDGQELYLTTKGKFKVESSLGELKGQRYEILQCTPLSLGDTTDCTFAKLFDGAVIDWENQIDGMALNFNATLPPLVKASTLDVTDESADEEALTGDDYAETVSQNDEEIDTFDFIDVAQELFLPVVSQ